MATKKPTTTKAPAKAAKEAKTVPVEKVQEIAEQAAAEQNKLREIKFKSTLISYVLPEYTLQCHVMAVC